MATSFVVKVTDCSNFLKRWQLLWLENNFNRDSDNTTELKNWFQNKVCNGRKSEWILLQFPLPLCAKVDLNWQYLEPWNIE